MNMESEDNYIGYFDFKERLDDINEILFDVNDKVIVNSKVSIRIKFTSKMDFPRRTQFRFIIPYGWAPINLKNNTLKILNILIR